VRTVRFRSGVVLSAAARKGLPIDLGKLSLDRPGLVLDPEAGAFPLLQLPFFFFAGGPILPGTQYLSWIHLDDTVGLLMLALIVLWLRPGASRRASGSQQAASTTVATAPSAPPAPGAAAAPAAPAPAAGSDPGVGPAAAAAAGHERRSEEKAAPKSVKPRPGGKRPRGAAAGRDPALSPEEDPDQAWR
jgi:hypothetical protein